MPRALRKTRRDQVAPGGSSGAEVVLAAIVGTPADRRAPREDGEV